MSHSMAFLWLYLEIKVAKITPGGAGSVAIPKSILIIN